MSRALRATVLVVAAVATLALGGCRGATPTAAPGVSSADPLGSVETSVDRIEKQIDHDGAG